MLYWLTGHLTCPLNIIEHISISLSFGSQLFCFFYFYFLLFPPSKTYPVASYLYGLPTVPGSGYPGSTIVTPNKMKLISDLPTCCHVLPFCVCVDNQKGQKFSAHRKFQNWFLKLKTGCCLSLDSTTRHFSCWQEMGSLTFTFNIEPVRKVPQDSWLMIIM